MCAMRVHIHIDDELISELDRRTGERGRSAYIEAAVRERLDRERRWDLIWSGVGAITSEGHPWDPDPAAYFSEERRRQSAQRGSV